MENKKSLAFINQVNKNVSPKLIVTRNNLKGYFSFKFYCLLLKSSLQNCAISGFCFRRKRDSSVAIQLLVFFFSISIGCRSPSEQNVYKLEKITFKEKPYKHDEKFAYFKGTGEFTSYRKKIEYDVYGNPVGIYQYKNSEMDTLNGPWVTFFQSGNVKGNGYFYRGKKNGRWEAFFDLISNGEQMLAVEENYLDDNLDGILTHYYENKQMYASYNYKFGKKDGIQRKWFDNGETMYEGSFEYGVLIYEKNWNESGEIIKR